jgi:hypothetical protein
VHIDYVFHDTQNGFRQSRGTNEHILAIERLMEEADVSKDRSLVITFIDFKKAVKRERMEEEVKPSNYLI